MQTKYKIDRETRRMLIGFVRKYDEYLLWYKAERDRIMYPARGQADGMPHGQGETNPTLSAVERLSKLEDDQKTRAIRAINNAKETLCFNIQSEVEREKIRRAVWLSCLNGHEYNFEAFAGGIACERRQFYYYKNEFLITIKNVMGL